MSTSGGPPYKSADIAHSLQEQECNAIQLLPDLLNHPHKLRGLQLSLSSLNPPDEAANHRHTLLDYRPLSSSRYHLLPLRFAVVVVPPCLLRGSAAVLVGLVTVIVVPVEKVRRDPVASLVRPTRTARSRRIPGARRRNTSSSDNSSAFPEPGAWGPSAIYGRLVGRTRQPYRDSAGQEDSTGWILSPCAACPVMAPEWNIPTSTSGTVCNGGGWAAESRNVWTTLAVY
ncbi:hypothetical protein DL767_006607 [Monosporascus sp. MG133]|nr:hypothetical protein DL767_006607 [Monosporascus sp. MG133]